MEKDIDIPNDGKDVEKLDHSYIAVVTGKTKQKANKITYYSHSEKQYNSFFQSKASSTCTYCTTK